MKGRRVYDVDERPPSSPGDLAGRHRADAPPIPPQLFRHAEYHLAFEAEAIPDVEEGPERRDQDPCCRGRRLPCLIVHPDARMQ
jgi:hypothetical protein